MNDRITIIRSAVGSTASPSSITLLKSLGLHVVGTDLHGNSAGAKLCDGFELVNQSRPGQNDEAIKDRYLEIIRKYNASFILSGPENEVLILSKHRKEFEACGCEILHPLYDDLQDIVDKYKMHQRLEGIIPQAAFYSSSDLHKVIPPIGKYIAKPFFGRGSNGVFKFEANTADDFRIVPNSDYLIQQFLEGKEYSVDVLCDLQGKLLNSVTRTRTIVDSGISMVSETVKIPSINEYVEKIVAEFSLVGLSCIQFIENGGDCFVTDINPRLGGSGVLSFQASPIYLKNFKSLLYKETLDYTKVYEYSDLKMMRFLCEIYE